MRKLISTAIIILGISQVSFGQVRVAPFLGYGDGLGLWGLGAYAEILMNDKMSISPYVTQYFPKKFDNAPRRSAWEVNGNLNYYFVRGDVGFLYGLAGINYTHIRILTRTVLADEIEDDNNIGLNLGIGTQFRISDVLFPFAEGKYTAGGYSQPSVIIGVKFHLGRETLEEDY